MDQQITRHKRQLEFLENALQKGKLAHAYVFAGPQGVGKKAVALRLAGELLGMGENEGMGGMGVKGKERGEGGFFHPDLLEVNSDNGIKIEQIRELIYKLSLKPYQAKHKVAIIDRADEMNIESSNAILKSLEEPKAYTYIILVTSNPNRLPKTILSRCQKITFGPLATEKSPEPEKYYDIFMSDALVEKLIAAYDIADLETGEIKALLDSWLLKLERVLQTQASKKLAHRISQVAASRRFLEQNVNSKLLLTNLMLNT